MEPLRNRIDRILRARKEYKRWLQVFICLSIIVVLLLEHVLGLNGIAMTRQERVLDCSFSGTAAHVHNADCYDAGGTLVCPLPEQELHEHDDLCYTWIRELTCGLEESEEHTHTEECYTLVRGDLICGKEEITETHIHDASCFRTVEIVEEEPEEVIEDAALVEEQPPVEEESPAPVFENDPTAPVLENESAAPDVQEEPPANDTAEELNAGILPVENAEITLPDAEDILESNPNADLETEAVWEGIFANWQRSGDWNQDLIAAAFSQIGYQESFYNFVTDENGIRHGYNRYGAWLGDSYAFDWSTAFVLFCLHYTGVTDEAFPRSADPEEWAVLLSQMPEKMYLRRGTIVATEDGEAEFVANEGDLIFFDTDYDQIIDRTGIVYLNYYDENGALAEIEVIEGDSEDSVRLVKYAPDDGTIIGYGVLPVNPELAPPAETESVDSEDDPDAENMEASGDPIEEGTEEAETGEVNPDEVENLAEERTTLRFTGDHYAVTAEFGPSALIPDDAELVVREIHGGQEYNEYLAQAEETVLAEGKSVQNAHFFDISFMKDGEEIEPADIVNIQIEYRSAEPVAKDAEVKAVHFVEGADATLLDTEVGGDEQRIESVSFTAESFSVYAIVYTVDFHWEVDGKTFDFSIPGGGFVSFTDLVEILGIAENTREFITNVESISFSSPELLSVSKVEEDTTVGTIKDSLGLECEYSAELTEEQIAEINAQTVEAGDWALISLKAFDTEESLTVTMKNGEQFVVSVTDYQNATSMSEFDGSTQFVIWTEDGSNCYALRADGETVLVNRNEIDALGQEFLWTVRYGWEQERDIDYRYIIQPVTNPQTSLTMTWTGQDLVQGGECGIRFYPHQSQNDVWYLEGWNWTRLYLNPNSHVFEVSMGQYTGSYSWIHFSKQEDLPQYEFTVQAESTDLGKGFVSGVDIDGINQQAQESYTAVTNQNKTNRNNIQASPLSARYLFDYWDLNGETLYWDPATQTISTEPGDGKTTDFSSIPAGKLTLPYNKSTLTAHFKRNPDYEVSDDEKEGRLIDQESLNAWLEELNSRDFPLNEDGCKKTAELYDYENRIYRVDLTAQSNLNALAGTVDLGFMIDVSASMKFPSKLDMVANWNNTQTTDNTDWQLQLTLNNINDNNWNKENWLNRGTEYYIIADKTSTATVDKIKFDWGSYSWRFKDASKDDTNYATIDHNTKFHRNDNTGLTYPIYVDGDNGLTRSYYLERSMSATLSELQDILDKINVAANPSQASDALIAYNKFHKDVIDSHYAFVPASTMSFGTYSYDGGTSTDRALADAQDFAWSSSAAKYAILITDGAPQRSGDDVPNDDVAAEALRLKNQGVTLITVGLSMGDVKRGSILLYDIASQDVNGDPYFYSAESGDELEYVLLEIIRQIMADAITVGNITDTINEAFYPVDKATGTALSNGNVIDLNGVKIADNVSSLTPAQKDAGYGVIGTAQDGNYNVTWSGQDIPWEGWHGTIYEKAKEDFLGGNAVRTNDPANPATIVPTGYKVDEDDEPIAFKQEIVTGKTQTLATPRVNVNELNLTENSSEWTVYLGTEVDPMEQLLGLFNNMHAEQVVTNAVDTDGDGLPDTMSGTSLYYPLQESTSDRRESEATGTKLSFSLHDVLKKSHGGNDVSMQELINAGENGITWSYDLYGQDNPGSITIKLTKTGSTAEYGSHVTTETGTPAETYSISVLFTPEYSHIPAGQGGDGSLPYNTGYFGLGTYGNAAGTEEGLNQHLINVYARTVEVEKRKPASDDTTDLLKDKPATFSIYRKWKSTDGEDKKVSLEGYTLNGTAIGAPSSDDDYYYLVESKQTENGVAKFTVGLSADEDPFYLAETVAPAGYQQNKTIQKITVSPGPELKTNLADAPSTPVPYNMTQGVTFYFDDSQDPAVYVDADGNQIVPITGEGARTYVLPTDDDGYFRTSVLNEPYASLQLKKQVTINDFDPDNSAVTNKTVADGTYIINVEGKEGTATEGRSYTIKITITNGAAVSATIKDNTVSGSTDTPAALTNGILEIPNLIPGEYTVTEDADSKTVLTAINSTDDDAVTDLDNRNITITLDGNAETVQLVTLTNNYADNSETDIAHVSVRKTFVGLKPGMKLPEGFKIQVKVTAVIDGITKTFQYTLTGETDISQGIIWNQSVNDDGDVVWNWKIAIHGLKPDAQVKVEEQNYQKPGYTVTPSANPDGGNGTSYTGSVSSSTVVQGTVAVITQQNSLTFPLTDNGNTAQIFVARIVPSQTSLVISSHKLSLSERAAVEEQLHSMPNAGDWYNNAVPLYYSFEDAANHKITVRNRSEVTYSETTPGDPSTGQITFDKKAQWDMVATLTMTYVEGRPADFNFTNSYTERGVGIDIVKVDKNQRTIKLPGAIFTLTKLDETSTPGHIVYKKIAGTDTLEKQEVSDATNNNGATSFSNLTGGYYEIKETQMPAGYVLEGDGCIYVKIEDGVAFYLAVSEDAETAITEWTKISQTSPEDLVQVTVGHADDPSTEDMDDTTNTLFSIGNTPGAELPNSGGPGTTLIYLLGIMLTAFATSAFVMKRRRRNAA